MRYYCLSCIVLVKDRPGLETALSHIPCIQMHINFDMEFSYTESDGDKLPHFCKIDTLRMYNRSGFKMVLAVLFICLCLLQQLKLWNCQVIGAGSCKSDKTDREEDLAMKVKNLYAAFDRYRLQTNKIETELLKTNELLVKAVDRISKLGKYNFLNETKLYYKHHMSYHQQICAEFLGRLRIYFSEPLIHISMDLTIKQQLLKGTMSTSPANYGRSLPCGYLNKAECEASCLHV